MNTQTCALSIVSVLRLSMLCAVPCFTGCTTASSFLPSVGFKKLDVTDISFEDIASDFVFEVDNPNPIEISLANFDYTLTFEDVEWITGDDPDGLVIAADDGSEVALPVELTFSELYEMIQAVRGEDEIDFNLQGSLGFDTPWGDVNLPYDADGDFPALRTPTFSFAKIKVADLNWTTAEIDLDFDVDNDHGSSLIFDNFAYALDLEDNSFASGNVDNLGEVMGGTTDTLTIPIEVTLLDAGAAAFDALTSDQVEMGIQASTDVDTPFGILPLTINESGNVEIE